MRLSAKEVEKVAKLASLNLSEGKIEKYSNQLSRILEYIEELNRADTSKVDATFNVSRKSNVLAKDSTKECLSQEEALSNGALVKDGFFETKRAND